MQCVRRFRLAQKSSAAGVGYLAFYLAIAILLAMVFNRAVFERADGIYTGVMNNLGDLPLHLQIIKSFAQGHNLPPEDPRFQACDLPILSWSICLPPCWCARARE